MAQEPFRFTDLPVELRLMTYEVLVQPKLRPLLPKKHEMYCEDVKLPTSLLLVSKFIYHDLKACVHKSSVMTRPITIVITRRSHLACAIICMLGTGHKMDTRHLTTVGPSIPDDNNFDRWTLILPIQLLKSLAKELYSSRIGVPAFEQALRDFLRISLLKLRRGRSVHIRVLCRDYDEDEANSIGHRFRSYLEFLRKASNEFDGFSPSIVIVKHDLIREAILRTMVRADIGRRRETVLGWEMPFEEPTALEMELLPNLLW
jgi:hypothetical protein